MTRPAVGLLHYTAPPVVGGVESIVMEQARRLAARGHRTIILAGRGGPLPGGAGVELAIMPELDSRHPEVLAVGGRLAQGLVDDAFTALSDRIRTALQDMSAGLDVLLAHNVLTLHFNLPLTAALWALADRGAPRVVSWCHDLAWVNPLYQRVLHDGAPWDLLRRVHPRIRTVCVSEQRRREWAGLTKASLDQVAVIPNGVDPGSIVPLAPTARALAERLGLWDVDVVLLAPVRITRRKNLEWAIQAAGDVRATGRRVRLLVSGPPGPHDPKSAGYLDELRALRHERGLDDEVRFLVEELAATTERSHPVDTATLASLYMLSDVVVLPSRSEGFGLPLAEAALLRVPVVCTDIPAFREVGGTEVRYVPAEGGPQAFSQAVLDCLTGPPVTLRRRVLRQLSWDQIIDEQLEPLLRA